MAFDSVKGEAAGQAGWVCWNVGNGQLFELSSGCMRKWAE